MSDALEYDDAEARREAAAYRTEPIAERRRLVRDRLDLEPGERVLSLGCGPGFEPAGLARTVGETSGVLAVDRSEAMLSLSDRRCADLPHVGHARGDATALPAATDSVDAATAVQVYEYVDALDAALVELARVLRPGGRAVVYDTDFDSLVWRADDRQRARRVLDAWDDHCPRPHLGSRLAPRLDEAGLAVERVEPYTILERQLDEDSFGYHLRASVREYVAAHEAVEAEEATAWADDLGTVEERGETFLSLTGYLHLVRAE